MAGDPDHPTRVRHVEVFHGPVYVGEVGVLHGEATVLLVLNGRWPGAVQLTPDQADQVAERLREQATHARRINNPDSG